MKRFMQVMVLCMLTASLAFAGGAAEADPEDPVVVEERPDQIRFRVAYTDPPRLSVGDESLIHVTPAAVYAFEDNITRSTGGMFRVEFQHSGALGGQVETLDQTQDAIIEATTPALPALAGYYPNIEVFSIPYLFDNPVIAWEVIDGPFGQALVEDMAQKTGLRMIAIFDNGGYRNFSNNVRPVRTPADMAGLRIRTMEGPAQMEIVRSMGGQATPIAWVELYSALETGVVDGQENSPATVIAGSLQEVQRYYTIDQHTLSLAAIVVSERWFQSLPQDVQKKVLVAGRAAAVAGRGAAYSNNSIALAYIGRQMEIYFPSPEERAAFRDVAQEPVVQWMRGQEAMDEKWIDWILEETEAARERLGL